MSTTTEKSFTLRMPAELHRRLKFCVLEQNTTMKDFIIAAVTKALQEQEQEAEKNERK